MTEADPTGLPADLSVLVPPPALASRYDRLVLVSHGRHVAALDPDPATLVVSTDWLAWRHCRARGIACVHFEFALAEWPEERGAADTVHLRCAEWVYDADGRDTTRLAGVSLGKSFLRSVTMFANAYERIWHALDRLCARFAPGEVVLIGLRAEFDLLGDAVARQVVGEIAGRHGARVVDSWDPPAADDRGFPENPAGFGVPDARPPLWRALLRDAYGRVVAGAFALRRLFDRRAPVLVIHNWATVAPLIDHHDSRTLVPAFFAASLPKRPALLWRLWRRGAALVHLPRVGLDAADERAIAAVADSIAARAATRSGVEGAVARFLLERVVATGWLRQQASAAKAHQRVFRRHRFARVLVGDSTNGTCRIVIETARAHGVAVDELPNGMFITPQRYDTRTGDRGGPALIDRMLCWGPAGERWIAAQAPGLARARTGYPAIDPLRRAPRPLARLERALVLPVYADCDDVPAFTSNIFGWLVATVAVLTERGCRVRVKLHSGPQNLDYYRDVLRQAGLDAEIVKGGALQPHLEWADFAVGPSNSGATVEALAAGLPYYAVVPAPSLIDPGLLPPTVVVRSPADLVDRLRRCDTPDIAAALDDLCGCAAIPNASRQVWRALEQG